MKNRMGAARAAASSTSLMPGASAPPFSMASMAAMGVANHT